MISLNELQTAVGESVNSAKLLGSVAAATTATGAAEMAGLIQGFLSTVAVLVGIGATLLLGRVHWQKYENEKKRGLLLERELEKAGVIGVLDIEED